MSETEYDDDDSELATEADGKKKKGKKKPPEPPPKTLDELRQRVDKRVGSGSLQIGRGTFVATEVFPTLIPSLDFAFGVGGAPCGRVLEVYGTESSGKTTTALQTIVGCQQHYFEKRGRNGVAAFIDVEHALDMTWAKRMGSPVTP